MKRGPDIGPQKRLKSQVFKMDQRHLFSRESCYTGVEAPASNFDLREIKQMLLSGNKDEITVAVGRVLSKINESEMSAMEMITSDMSEFLCDAMLPFEPYISGTIYTCLGIMTRYKYFFIHNHSSFAMETVIRALNFIIKNGGHDTTVRQPLNVIVLIVQGYACFDVMPDKKPFENLLNLLSMLLGRNPISQEMKYQGGVIIKSLFEIDLWKFGYAQKLMEICGKWFDLICMKGEYCHMFPEELMNLGCFLSEQALRYLTNEGTANQLIHNEMNNESNSQTGIMENVIIFLVDMVAPEMQKLLSCQKQEIEWIEMFFTCLIYIFNEQFPQGRQVADKLCQFGFIQLINNILSQDHLLRYEKLGKICMAVLTQILLSLSDDVFHLTEMWPSGRDYFRKEISVGMSLLPLNATRWLDKLSDAGVNRSSRLALIIYFYFYLLTANSTVPTESVYLSTVKLLNLPIEINSTIVKAVWFIFVISQISKDRISPETDIWATKKMLDILESQTEFSLVYTHHPALLYWAFSSSRISCKIQCQVVKLWLENRSPDCTVLDDLMRNCADTRLSVFQLLEDDTHGHVAHLAFSSLKNFMVQSNDETLCCNVWFSLPKILAKYTTDTSTATQVHYIVELATLKVPQRPDISKMVRIATLLPDALRKSDMLSSYSALKLALQLLDTSLKHEDNQVLFAFLRCDHFMQTIITGIAADLSHATIMRLKIINILWNAKFPSIPCFYKTINIDVNEMLKVFDCNDVEVIKTGLVLMEQMLTTQFESVLVNVQGVSTQFGKMLLFSLENVLFKHLPTVSAWKCLEYCLEQESSLADDCFLHEVTKYGLQYLKETPDMVDFLIVWMRKKTEAERFFDGSREIRQNYFLETIEEIALFLSQNFFQHWDRLSLKVLECCKHFSVDTSCEPYKRITDTLAINN